MYSKDKDLCGITYYEILYLSPTLVIVLLNPENEP